MTFKADLELRTERTERAHLTPRKRAVACKIRKTPNRAVVELCLRAQRDALTKRTIAMGGGAVLKDGAGIASSRRVFEITPAFSYAAKQNTGQFEHMNFASEELRRS